MICSNTITSSTDEQKCARMRGLKGRGKNCSREGVKAQGPSRDPGAGPRLIFASDLYTYFVKFYFTTPRNPLNSSNKVAVTYVAQTANTQF
jgi:hypothetical protein